MWTGWTITLELTMQEINPGTDRWQEISAIAESLHRDGTLTYDRLKQQAKCCGAVAKRVIDSLKEDAHTPTTAEGGTTPDAPDATAGLLLEPWESQWNEDSARLKRRAAQAFYGQLSQQTASHGAEIRRLQLAERELQLNLDSALEDVLLFSQSTKDAETRLAEKEEMVAALHRRLEDVTTRCSQAEADLARDREEGRLAAAVAESTRTETVMALARAETEATHWHRRAEIAEEEVQCLRKSESDARTRVARLEGEMEAGTKANADLRSLLETHATSQQRASSAGETRSRAAK